MRILKTGSLVLLLLLSAWGAEAQTRKNDLPPFKDDMDRDSLYLAVHRSLEFLEKLPADRPVGGQPRKFTAREIKESLLSFINLLDLWNHPKILAEEIPSHFDLYGSGSDSGGGNVLFTGYYQPMIKGSLTETSTYRFPVYRKPKDLIEAKVVTVTPKLLEKKIVGRLEGDRLVPYLSRHEIDGLGLLKGRGNEIAWVRDPVELFFLHIQGSGLLRLEDGRLLHLNYAVSNGRPYRSIGRILIDSGKVPERGLSMPRLLRYLKEHPEERDALFAQNERYVFFRFVKNGPLGSLEVPLTPGRSIATDSRLFPKGALAFVVSQRPILDATGNLIGWQPFSRFVLNQDTGSAIRGPGRADLYFGSGYEAGLAAGSMKSSGMLYFLIKKKASQ